MNILVTGSNGQLGNQMRLLGPTSTENHYIFTDINTIEGVDTTFLDITNYDQVIDLVRKEQIQVIVNCAAYTNVDRAEDDEEMADLINHKAVGNLARACYEEHATLIHVSTDYVFQGNGCVPCTEEQQTSPLGVYGRTKLAGEEAILSSGCSYLIFRTAWLYSSFGGNFVKTMRRLTKEKDSLQVVFDQVGTPTYAGDLAEAIFQIIESNKFVDHTGIYHYSNEGVCSWYDFTIEIRDLSGNACAVYPCHSSEFPSKVKRPHFSVLDKTKFKQTFGILVPYWKESLRRCIKELDFKGI